MSVGLLGHTLTAPVLGPIRGLLWLARTIEERAKTELYDEDKIRGELTELELALDLKQIDLTDYEAREEVLLRRFKEIPGMKGGGAPHRHAVSSAPEGDSRHASGIHLGRTTGAAARAAGVRATATGRADRSCEGTAPYPYRLRCRQRVGIHKIRRRLASFRHDGRAPPRSAGHRHARRLRSRARRGGEHRELSPRPTNFPQSRRGR